jgi:hypothetical protein
MQPLLEASAGLLTRNGGPNAPAQHGTTGDAT